MAKAELSVRYGFAIAGDPQRLPAIIKALRRDRPKTERRERPDAVSAAATCGGRGKLLQRWGSSSRMHATFGRREPRRGKPSRG
eukprot:6326442-Prymnesium_polylepis.1